MIESGSYDARGWPQMGEYSRQYLEQMARCAAFLGRQLGPIRPRHVERRLHESEAELVARGLDAGLLEFEGNYLRSRDPHQHTAWLVEGDPAHLCWEYLPHMAAYVELVLTFGYPVGAVRFETPDAEMNLDLAVVDTAGAIMVLGEVKTESRQIVSLANLLPGFVVDPGKPDPVRRGGPQGARREAWKLAHQLWVSRASWLWLVASGARLAFRVEYDDGLVVSPTDTIPSATELGADLSDAWSRIQL